MYVEKQSSLKDSILVMINTTDIHLHTLQHTPKLKRKRRKTQNHPHVNFFDFSPLIPSNFNEKLLKSHIMTNQKLSIYFCRAECLLISLLDVRQHPKHTFTHTTPEKTDSNRHRDTQHNTQDMHTYHFKDSDIQMSDDIGI